MLLGKFGLVSIGHRIFFFFNQSNKIEWAWPIGSNIYGCILQSNQFLLVNKIYFIRVFKKNKKNVSSDVIKWKSWEFLKI